MSAVAATSLAAACVQSSSVLLFPLQPLLITDAQTPHSPLHSITPPLHCIASTPSTQRSLWVMLQCGWAPTCSMLTTTRMKCHSTCLTRCALLVGVTRVRGRGVEWEVSALFAAHFQASTCQPTHPPPHQPTTTVHNPPTLCNPPPCRHLPWQLPSCRRITQSLHTSPMTCSQCWGRRSDPTTGGLS